MSASPVEFPKDARVRLAFRYLLITILCVVFGAVYEAFSHGVYAFGMVYAFAIPLLGGVLPTLLLTRHGRALPSGTAVQLWHFGISALTVGSLFSGALEIYGTTNALVIVYPIAGTVPAIASFAAAFIGRRFSRPARRTPPYRKTKSPAP